MTTDPTTDPTADLTAGEFQAMTGLSTKALRLYAERSILIPARVDPRSGYRYYAREQLQQGVTVDLLRRAQVPLAELAGAAEFPFETWRQSVQLRRIVEDFYLDVAEKISAFDAADFLAHSTAAPAVDWVGVIIGLDIPEDAEGRIEAFSGLAVDTPAVERAFGEALGDLAVGAAGVAWTAVPDIGGRSADGQMLLARPAPVGGGAALSRSDLESIEHRVHARTGQSVTAVTGALPHRIEVTFTAAVPREPTPVDEAAEGYLHLLAFENHLARHDLTAIRPTARMVTKSGTLFGGAGAPVGTFDIRSE
jgi:DNA-binding transcriptional MerR regulator